MTPQPYHLPLINRLLRPILQPVFRGLFHILSQVSIEGAENIPKSGAYLITINHVSLFDPPFVLAFWPTMPEAAGAVEIWERPGQAILARLFGGIPVHRGQVDRKLIDTMVSVIQSGRPLLIAPEGGRTHTPGLRRALPGAAHILDQAPTDVVPVGVVGATDDFFTRAKRAIFAGTERPKISMRVGKPFRLPPIEGKGAARRLERQRNADLIMLHIAEILPLEYRGVYANGMPIGVIE